jgi:hypothetical protein
VFAVNSVARSRRNAALSRFFMVFIDRDSRKRKERITAVSGVARRGEPFRRMIAFSRLGRPISLQNSKAKGVGFWVPLATGSSRWRRQEMVRRIAAPPRLSVEKTR